MDRLDASVRDALRLAGVPDAGELAAIVAAWPACVGPAVARHAWPLRITRDGILRVACSSSTWAFELDRMAPDVLAALRERLPAAAPAGLRFAPGPVPAPGADGTEDGPAAPSPSTAELETATRLAAGIEDPDLRELAERAIAASLARRRDDRAF